MTVMVVMALLGGCAGVLGGGKWRDIARLRVRRWWLLVVAVVIQGTLSLMPAGARATLVVVACGAVIAWCASNLTATRVVAGMVVLGLGVVSNVIVIALNGGMPVSRSALVWAGLGRNFDVSRGHLDKHVAPLHPHLGFLGDFIPIPVIHNVLSLGDVAMLVGIFLVMRAATLLGVTPGSLPVAAVAPIGPSGSP